MSQAHALEALIEALRRLPGVGAKSASRMAFHLLQHDREGAMMLARSLTLAVDRIGHCKRCHTFSEQEICVTCQDASRDASRLCVVETPADQTAVERTASYKGLYFVLMGKLSPLDRLGILSDAFEAAKAGYTDTASALTLLEAYSNEDNSAVWDVMVGNLSSIRVVMNDSDLRSRGSVTSMFLRLWVRAPLTRMLSINTSNRVAKA